MLKVVITLVGEDENTIFNFSLLMNSSSSCFYIQLYLVLYE